MVCGGEEGAVIQRHLAVLEQIVEQRQHVSFCLLHALQDEDTAVQRGAQRRCRLVLDGTGADLAPLLQVGLARVARHAHILHLPRGRAGRQLRGTVAGLGHGWAWARLMNRALRAPLGRGARRATPPVAARALQGQRAASCPGRVRAASSASAACRASPASPGQQELLRRRRPPTARAPAGRRHGRPGRAARCLRYSPRRRPTPKTAPRTDLRPHPAPRMAR
eukprot:5069023-Prymnesium_polylepis.2